MDLVLADKELEECELRTKEAIRRWGPVVGDHDVQRVVLLADAPTFEAVHQIRSLRLHKLTGDRKDDYAITLHGRWRLVISPVREREVLIQEVTNHYGD